MPVLSVILAIVSLLQMKKDGLLEGKRFAIAALIIDALFFALAVVMLIILNINS